MAPRSDFVARRAVRVCEGALQKWIERPSFLRVLEYWWPTSRLWQYIFEVDAKSGNWGSNQLFKTARAVVAVRESSHDYRR